MDKFDEFLKKRTEDEDKDFALPESFDLKIEETLSSLEDDKKDKWYINKKIISMVACFVLVFLVGLRYMIFDESLGMDKSSSTEMAADNVQRRGINKSETSDYSSEPEIANYSLGDSVNVNINKDEVKGLTIKSLSGEAKFKFVNEEKDIENIIDSINNIYKLEVIDQGISEWDFLIQTSGSINHTIEVKGNLINIDNRSYEAEEDVSKIIKNIYSNLNYEEKDIKYCNVTY
ncbi:Uncharacterised protein [uncultured Clostridium sp.]|uniref:hypothetical protein n=1 Tax=uncultured Clostridium sp. TaxID=59620 RepID=UPI0008233A65|nr:hypothetical protein [uncultured Clostridium sp.]SCJ94828.1 Uncharacterised protein [uncultured Clostridium sp.]